jgi:transmembrane sensor
MNAPRDPAPEATISREAREWLIRLDGDERLNAAEREKLREWMARSPSHTAELKHLAQFWNNANILTELAVPLRSLAPQNRAVPTSHSARWTFAAACLCGLIAGGLWWFHSGRVPNGTYVTALGQQRTLPLEDGSTIEMNTDSQVQVDYSDQLRKIRLLRGEALFKVTPNKERPFKVFAARGVVRAVGTAFAVAIQGTDLRVTVTKGEVEVSEDEPAAPLSTTAGQDVRLPPTHVALKAGQTATINAKIPAQPETLPSAELERRLSWQTGYLAFTGQSLQQVVDEVNRYSAISLEIADPKLAGLAVGGRFKVGDLDAVCDALQSTFGIRVVRLDDQHWQLRASRSL